MAVPLTYEFEDLPRQVRLWTTVRPPFEPKGDVAKMRELLRERLKALSPGPGLFTSLAGAAGNYDIENVLLYNLQPSTVRHLAQDRLVIERSRESAPSPSGVQFPWQLSYGTVEGRQEWQRGPRLAEVRLAGQAALPPRAADYWAASHRLSAAVERAWDKASPLMCDLLIGTARPNLAEVIKPVLDGLMSALHCYTGPELDEVVLRAASQSGADEGSVREWLARGSCLGERRFVWPFQRSLQWSPADDALVRIDVTRVPTSSGWSLTFALYEAVPTQ